MEGKGVDRANKKVSDCSSNVNLADQKVGGGEKGDGNISEVYDNDEIFFLNSFKVWPKRKGEKEKRVSFSPF